MNGEKTVKCWGCTDTIEVSVAINKGWRFNGVSWVCRECREAMKKGMQPKP